MLNEFKVKKGSKLLKERFIVFVVLVFGIILLIVGIVLIVIVLVDKNFIKYEE